jgi:hypothetical protein
MFVLSRNHVTERGESGDKNTRGTSPAMVQERCCQEPILTAKRREGVEVKSFVVSYKCPALRRPEKERSL